MREIGSDDDAEKLDNEKTTSPLTLSLSEPPKQNHRTKQELSHPGNEGLADVVEWLKPIAEAASPKLSLADVIQLAAAVVVEGAGGPVLGFEPGRRDSWAYAPEGRLFNPRRAAREAASGNGGGASTSSAAAGPSSVRRSASGGGLPFSCSPSPSPVLSAQARALRAFAARLGMPLRHVVALAGAHRLGRWWPDAEASGSSSSSSSSSSSPESAALLPLITAPAPGSEGAPRFDNSYFTMLLDGSLPSASDDAFLLADAETRLLVEEYAASEATFFVDYAAAHDELSRLGMPRGAGGWHRQHRQEEKEHQRESHHHHHHHHRGRHHHKDKGGSSHSTRVASPCDAARRSGGGSRGGAAPPSPPPSYWASWTAIDNLATVLGVSHGAAAAASAAVATVAVVGGAALVWSRRRNRLVGRRR